MARDKICESVLFALAFANVVLLWILEVILIVITVAWVLTWLGR